MRSDRGTEARASTCDEELTAFASNEGNAESASKYKKGAFYSLATAALLATQHHFSILGVVLATQRARIAITRKPMMKTR
jgi:hypothetical protein